MRCPQNERDVGMKLQSEHKSHLNQCSWRDCLGHPSIAKDSERLRALLVFSKTLAFRVQSHLNVT